MYIEKLIGKPNVIERVKGNGNNRKRDRKPDTHYIRRNESGIPEVNIRINRVANHRRINLEEQIKVKLLVNPQIQIQGYR